VLNKKRNSFETIYLLKDAVASLIMLVLINVSVYKFGVASCFNNVLSFYDGHMRFIWQYVIIMEYYYSRKRAL